MEDKLEQARAEYVDKLKRVALLDVGVAYEDVEKYVKYVTADDEAEIKEEAQEVASDITGNDGFGDVYVDERVWKPFGN